MRLTFQLADVNAVELQGEDALEEGLLSGRSSSDERRARTLAGHPADDNSLPEEGEEMSLDEIDRELQAQGVGKPDDQWGDSFSDFDESEQQRHPEEDDSDAERTVIDQDSKQTASSEPTLL